MVGVAVGIYLRRVYAATVSYASTGRAWATREHVPFPAVPCRYLPLTYHYLRLHACALSMQLTPNAASLERRPAAALRKLLSSANGSSDSPQ